MFALKHESRISIVICMYIMLDSGNMGKQYESLDDYKEYVIIYVYSLYIYNNIYIFNIIPNKEYSHFY